METTSKKKGRTYCPACGYANRSIARFCATCGTPLLKETLNQETLLENRYQIIRKLAQGGMGNSYLAKAVWQQGQLVVIQMSSDPETVGLFRNQVEILGRIKHPNLPVILDNFSLEQGKYIVMEYVGGDNLAQILEDSSSPLPEKQVIEWASQLCDALSYLHAQEPPIIHRNVKPQNIIISDNNIVKLVDFGIARRYKAERTKDEEVYGTPGYAPPEQYGTAQTNVRSDIYALGVTLYVLLTKYDPEIAHFNFPPLRSLNPTVSIETEAVIHKAIQPDVTNRFHSAVEMQDALLTGNLKFIERHPDWPVWEQKIYRALQGFGRVKTIELGLIPDKFCLAATKKYFETHVEQDISYVANFEGLQLNDTQNWETLEQWWQDATQNTKLSEELIEKIVQKLQETLCVEVVKKRTQIGRLSVYFWNMETILSGVKIGPILPLVVPYRHILLESDLKNLRDIFEHKAKGAGRVALLLLFGSQQELQRIKRLLDAKMKRAHVIDIIPLAYDELFQIAIAKTPQKMLRKIILSQVDLTFISPFNTTRAVWEDNFFGREKELRTIVEQASSASFTIIGGRRVGKSSLLVRLHRVRLPAEDIYSIYHDGATTSTYQDFMATPIKNWQPKPPPNAPATFGDLTQNPSISKPLVLLLDEADEFIPADRANGWPFFKGLRALANYGHIQFVFSGSQTLREALSDSTGPFFNFANEILLGPLEPDPARELITVPMSELEITMSDEAAVVAHIYRFTSGHPYIIQQLCHNLIERLNTDNRRQITLDDVNAVVEDSNFIRKHFLGTYLYRASALEHLCALIMTTAPDLRTLHSVHQILIKTDIPVTLNQVDAALGRLVDLRSILKRTPEGYDFAVAAFPAVVSNGHQVANWIALRREIFIHAGDISPELAPDNLKGDLWS